MNLGGMLQVSINLATDGPYSWSCAGSNALSIDDLLAPLSGSKAGADALKKAVKPASSSVRNGLLSAPLPTRMQEKIERDAAYEKTKEEVDKWNSTMRRIKEVHAVSSHLMYLTIYGCNFPEGRTP